MSYRVEYGALSGKLRQPGWNWGRILMFTVCFLALFGYLTFRFWPEGAGVLSRLSAAEDCLLTRRALETMAVELRSGTPLGDAVTAFCREVISEGMAVGQ